MGSTKEVVDLGLEYTNIIFYSTYCAAVVIPQVCNQRSLTRVLVLSANTNGQKV